MASINWRKEVEALLEEEVYYNCEASLYSFLVAAWERIDTAKFKDSWHLKAVCNHVQACLEGEIKNLIINIPPRHGKSTIAAVAAPCWQWGPAGKPETKFFSFSYAQPLSTRDAVKSRKLINHPWYQKQWGKTFKFSSDQNMKTRYENNKGGERISSSVSGMATGEGYDVLVVDDPLNANKEYSEAALNEVIEWWTGTMATRANDPTTARRIIIMQRIHQSDLVGYILEKEHGWFNLCLPMEYETTHWVSPIGFKDPRKTEGDILCPDRFPKNVVDNLKLQLGEYKASAQLQQRPVPVGGGIIKEQWLRYYSSLQEYDIVIQAWDLAQVEGKFSDYTVGQVWGKKDGNRFLLDQYRAKVGVLDQAKAIVEMSRKWQNCRAVLIENKANGYAVEKILKDPDHISLYKFQVSGIVMADPKKHGGSKEERLLACVAEFSAGNVFFPLQTIAPWVTDTIKELTFFPKAAHDDTVDALAYALSYLSSHSGVSSVDYSEIGKLMGNTKTATVTLYSDNVFEGSRSNSDLKNIWN